MAAERLSVLELLKKHVQNDTQFPFHNVSGTKAQCHMLMDKYRLSQWLSASRGLLPNVTPSVSDAPRRQEFAPGRLDEDDELVLARLRAAQSLGHNTLSKLDSSLVKLEKALLSTRKRVWVRTGIVALLFSAILGFFVLSARHGHTRLLDIVPRSCQPLIPLIPSPIALFLIAARERQISAVAAARGRIQELLVAVASSQPVSVDDIAWLGTETWDGVDFGLIGL